MEMVEAVVQRIFYSSSSVFSRFGTARYLQDEELEDVYRKLTGDFEGFAEDKRNMSSDVHNLRSDFRKALKSYVVEHRQDVETAEADKR